MSSHCNLASYPPYGVNTSYTSSHMARNKEMAPTMRARICELNSIGWGYRKIHKKYPEIPVSTIRYTITSQNDRDDHVSKPRSGRPPVLTPEQKEHLCKLVAEDPNIKLPELQAAIGSTPSRGTVRRLLRQHASRPGQNSNHHK